MNVYERRNAKVMAVQFLGPGSIADLTRLLEVAEDDYAMLRFEIHDRTDGDFEFHTLSRDGEEWECHLLHPGHWLVLNSLGGPSELETLLPEGFNEKYQPCAAVEVIAVLDTVSDIERRLDGHVFSTQAKAEASITEYYGGNEAANRVTKRFRTMITRIDTPLFP